ncbi:hypothetical protein BCR33DRAFT_782306 [Rhizoclosmatium globosum]|uniref:Uncharacterized protein n=1 Tax=Rhizoclosmatium globosum TaxID=329046 RepID=A0A1Y2CNI9_9FUNG|nr:hypothetical protein BCR33DRAFT_782306 [Rhizoclosmatium globosum]|eukprot:ORY48599.1 hypothetical protein BCR33DRAFT_782306 [Rhizoclosmatium globosum]
MTPHTTHPCSSASCIDFNACLLADVLELRLELMAKTEKLVTMLGGICTDSNHGILTKRLSSPMTTSAATSARPSSYHAGIGQQKHGADTETTDMSKSHVDLGLRWTGADYFVDAEVNRSNTINVFADKSTSNLYQRRGSRRASYFTGFTGNQSSSRVSVSKSKQELLVTAEGSELTPTAPTSGIQSKRRVSKASIRHMRTAKSSAHGSKNNLNSPSLQSPHLRSPMMQSIATIKSTRQIVKEPIKDEPTPSLSSSKGPTKSTDSLHKRLARMLLPRTSLGNTLTINQFSQNATLVPQPRLSTGNQPNLKLPKSQRSSIRKSSRNNISSGSIPSSTDINPQQQTQPQQTTTLSIANSSSQSLPPSINISERSFPTDYPAPRTQSTSLHDLSSPSSHTASRDSIDHRFAGAPEVPPIPAHYSLDTITSGDGSYSHRSSIDHNAGTTGSMDVSRRGSDKTRKSVDYGAGGSGGEVVGVVEYGSLLRAKTMGAHQRGGGGVHSQDSLEKRGKKGDRSDGEGRQENVAARLAMLKNAKMKKSADGIGVGASMGSGTGSRHFGNELKGVAVAVKSPLVVGEMLFESSSGSLPMNNVGASTDRNIRRMISAGTEEELDNRVAPLGIPAISGRLSSNNRRSEVEQPQTVSFTPSAHIAINVENADRVSEKMDFQQDDSPTKSDLRFRAVYQTYLVCFLLPAFDNKGRKLELDQFEEEDFESIQFGINGLHPKSYFNTGWDFIITILYFVCLWMIPYTIAFNLSHSIWITSL